MLTTALIASGPYVTSTLPMAVTSSPRVPGGASPKVTASTALTEGATTLGERNPECVEFSVIAVDGNRDKHFLLIRHCFSFARAGSCHIWNLRSRSDLGSLQDVEAGRKCRAAVRKV